MRKIQAVVVANSYKHNGRCLALIELQTSELIRPVSTSEGREIPGNFTIAMTGKEPHKIVPGDFITMSLLEPDTENWQRENWFADLGTPITLLTGEISFLKERANQATKLRYLDPQGLLIDASPYIAAIEVTREKASLELRLVENLVISVRTRINGAQGLKARFLYQGKEFEFPYTGQQSELVSGTKLARAVICLSLGEEYSGAHYKLVAGILELI